MGIWSWSTLLQNEASGNHRLMLVGHLLCTTCQEDEKQMAGKPLRLVKFLQIVGFYQFNKRGR